MSLAAELREALHSVRDKIEPADLELATRVMIRYGELSTRRLAGEDVDDDIRAVMASLENIQAGVAGSLATMARNRAMDFVTRALRGILASL